MVKRTSLNRDVQYGEGDAEDQVVHQGVHPKLLPLRQVTRAQRPQEPILSTRIPASRVLPFNRRRRKLWRTYFARKMKRE